jgi:hypothetical protein
MLDRACAGLAFPKTVEKAFAGQISADFVPNFWQVMNPKAKKRTVGKRIFPKSAKKQPLTSKMGGAIFSPKKELPI